MSPSTLRDNPSPPRRERVQVDRLAVLRMRAAIPLPVVGQEEPVHPVAWARWLGRRWREEAVPLGRGEGRDAR